MTETAAFPSPPSAPSLFRRILAGIDGITVVLVVLTTTGMVGIIVAQVFLRYIMNSSLDWAEEVSRLLFVWSVFLAIPLGVRKGAHVSVDLITGALPLPVRDGLFRAMCALAIVLMAVVAWQAAILTFDQWDEPMTTLDISVGLFVLPLTLGSVHAIMHFIIGILDGPPIRTVIVE